MNVVYADILQLLPSAFNMIGTIYAVLSILKLKQQEIYKSITTAGIDLKDKELIIQKKQASIGLSLIVYSWVLQIIYLFIDTNVYFEFWCAFLLSLLGGIIVFGIGIYINKNFKNKYLNFKAKNKEFEEPHSKAHEWGEF